ncbi:MAG: holo-ACP synthase [bacterium]
MIRSIGLDLVDVERLRRDIDKYGERFISRLLGRAERELYAKRSDQARFLAGRFAAKEAVVKALAPFLNRRPAWSAIEILSDSQGQPYLRLPDNIDASLGGAKCLLSITHERQYAAAVAVFEDRT